MTRKLLINNKDAYPRFLDQIGNQPLSNGVVDNSEEGVTSAELDAALATPVDSRPYKVYTALLTQSGTSDPTSVVLENTLGVTPTLNYEDVAKYSLTITGDLFADTSKVFVSFKTDTIYYNGAARAGLLVRVDGFGIDPSNPAVKSTSPNGEIFMADGIDDPTAVYDPNKTFSNGTWEIIDDNTITLFTGVNGNLTNATFEIRVYN